MKRIAFIGLGAMGRPIAERLLQGGYDLTVFDVNRDAMAPLIAAGAREAASPEAAAEHAQAVFTTGQSAAQQDTLVKENSCS